MLAADNWCVKVDEKIYGPYSSEQMRKYAHEGRVASTTLISPAGSRAWREAREEAAFASFFGFKHPANSNQKCDRAFGRCETRGSSRPSEAHRPKKAGVEKPDIQPANFVLIFDVVNAAASRVGAAINSLGEAFRIADNVWTVNCELTAVGVRNAIAPYLAPHESLFVVDTTRGRTSWQNYAPELHAKLSAAYAAVR
ncbi:MAG: DUF4339 domain-containing protein [Hyphococcus sp.]